MRHRTLSIALLIAASLTPIAGCSDHDESANTPDQNSDLAADQTTDHAGNRSHNDSPIPVNDPNASDKSGVTAAASKPKPPAPDRVRQLAQQIATIKQTHQKRLNDQARRIDALEQQVAALTKRLQRLPQPAAQTDSDGQSPQADSTPAPGAVSPQSGDNDATDGGNKDTSADDADVSDANAPSDDASPAAGPVSGENIVKNCPNSGGSDQQFDVFFQAANADALDAAADQVKSAGISDWFARARMRRLFVGRYGNCPLAAHRRADVHQRTGLALNIRAVTPRRTSATHSRARDYGAQGHGASAVRRAATQAIRPPVATDAPFAIVGVEVRGTHHFLGVGPQGAARLSGVSWLTPGDAYGTWTLRAIRTNAGTATFTHDGRTVAVALPRRG